MRVTISSPLTVFFKFVFPGLWFLGCVAAALANSWLLAGILGVFFCVLLLYALQLKRVVLDAEHDYLEISNYFRSQQVPCSAISAVIQRVWRRPEIVWVTFTTTTDFGSTIGFVPKFTEAWLFAEHPVVLDLRSLMKAQSDRQRRVG